MTHFRGFKEKINKCLQDLYHQAKAVVQAEIDFNNQLAVGEESQDETPADVPMQQPPEVKEEEKAPPRRQSTPPSSERSSSSSSEGEVVKTIVAQGRVQQIPNDIKEASAGAPASVPAPKRRGRNSESDEDYDQRAARVSGEMSARRGTRGRKPRVVAVDNDDSDVAENKPKRGRGRGRGAKAAADRRSSCSSSDRRPVAKKPTAILDEYGNPIVKRRGRPPKNPEKIKARELEDARIRQQLNHTKEDVRRNFVKVTNPSDRLEDMLEREVVQKEQAARRGHYEAKRVASSSDSSSNSSSSSSR